MMASVVSKRPLIDAAPQWRDNAQRTSAGGPYPAR